MGIDLFSLRMNLETTGVNNAMSGLKGVEEQGAKTAASLDRNASASLNGAKGFRDIDYAAISASEALGTAAGQTAKVAEQGEKAATAHQKHAAGLRGVMEPLKALAEAYLVFEAIDFVGDAIEQASALHELSQKTGATVEMLSVLEFAGRRANVSAQQLAMGFRGLGLSLDALRDDKKGTGDVAQAFGKIGLAAKDFVGLNTDQAFQRIVTALAPLPDGLEKSELASRIFGRAGAELVPLLDDLATNGFAKTREEAEKFHAVISEKMAEDADELHDKWGDLKSVFASLAREVVPVLIPALQALVSLMQQGPSDTFRNTWREMAALADVFTGGMATKYFQSQQNPFAGVEGGSSTASLSPAVRPPPKPVTASEQRERLRRLLEQEGSPIGAALDLMSPTGFSTSDIAPRTDLGAGTQGTATPHGRETQDTFWFDRGKFAAKAFYQGLGDEQGQDRGARWVDALVGAAGQVRTTFENLGANLGMTVGNGFAAALAAGIHGKNPFKAFGNVVLQGLGSIMSQMGQALLAYGVTMLKLLPFLTNIFTSGPAAIVAGIALMALGSTLGGIATGGGHGGGGGGSGQSQDRITQIHLTADGAGGFGAPSPQRGPVYKVVGAKDPEAHRILGDITAAGMRRGIA